MKIKTRFAGYPGCHDTHSKKNIWLNSTKYPCCSICFFQNLQYLCTIGFQLLHRSELKIRSIVDYFAEIVLKYCEFSGFWQMLAECSLKSLIFRRDFHKFSSEFREMPDDCRRSMNFVRSPEKINNEIEKFCQIWQKKNRARR